MVSRSKGEEDRLSALPDSVLTHILSFLPTKEVVRTDLIHRFGALWTSLPNLDLDDNALSILWTSNDNNNDEEELYFVNHGFFKFVHNVLRLQQRPTIDFFRVHISTFFFEDIKAKNRGHELDSWITFALRKQVKSLEFGFGMVEPDLELYQLPFPEFVNDSLIELKLVYIEMKLQRRVQMGSLTVLRLVWVVLSEHVFEEIIRGCPLLKELEVDNCGDLYESLELGGCVEGLEVMNNLSSLVDISFYDGARHEFNAFAQFKSVLSKLLHAKSMSLPKSYVTVLFYLVLKGDLDLRTNWKNVELNIWLTERHIPGICSLLRNSSYIQQLVLNVSSLSCLEPIEYELSTNQILCEEPEYWSRLKRLVICSISRNGYGTLVNLVEILLKNASVLDELVIDSNWRVDSSLDSELTSDQRVDLSDKLMNFSRASKHATVKLVC